MSVEDLADDVVLHPLDDTLDWEQPAGQPAIERPATTADAVELVAAGVGLLVVPQSLARLHHRKDLTYRPVTDAPESRVALSWPRGADHRPGGGLHRHRARPDRQQLAGRVARQPAAQKPKERGEAAVSGRSPPHGVRQAARRH